MIVFVLHTAEGGCVAVMFEKMGQMPAGVGEAVSFVGQSEHAVLAGVTSGQQADPTGRTGGVDRVRVPKDEALFSHTL